MIKIFKKELNANLATFVVFAALIIGFLIIFINCEDFKYNPENIFNPPQEEQPAQEAPEDIKSFASEEDFKDYLAKIDQNAEYYLGMGFGGGERMLPMEAPAAEGDANVQKTASAGRVSETNVQVEGIDEPDVVKTDGKKIYFSPGIFWAFWREGIALPMSAEKIAIPPYQQEQNIDIINAFPPQGLAKEGEIKETGDLLLSKNNLIIFTGRGIKGYDVSDPKNPKEKWDMDYEGKSALVSARMFQDKIYLVLQNSINKIHPCPIEPLALKGEALQVSCQDIYHPIYPVPADVTFFAAVLDPQTGKIENKISFIGSSGLSVVYMSEANLYITYSYFGSILDFTAGFLREKCADLVPSALLERVSKLESYDISQQSKILEFQIVWQNYLNSLGDDERLRVENELANRMSDYYKDHKRELQKTGIVRIGLKDFFIKASGSIPGALLNQFSLDEYQNNLRAAVTIGQQWWLTPFPTGRESSNDVYVLDENLKTTGKILDLGANERIYSARFIGDKGYLVTFRETDPFYVLDLSDPTKPVSAGELKIPGYSSYLHPVSESKILGIGQEDWQVKISLFDVSLPENPGELDKYILDEGWSEVLSNHHAFLLDARHDAFFLPGGKGGYVFSFAGDKLELKKAVSNITAKRALYLDDFMYIIGDDRIVVLNEANWEKIKELDLTD